MKGLKDWVFTVSNTVASSRPLSGSGTLFRGGSRPEEPNDQSHAPMSSVAHPDTSCLNSSGAENQQESSLASSYQLCHDLNKKKWDPLVKINDLKIKFLRLVERLGQPQNNLLVAKVLYRIQLATLIRAEESELKTLEPRNDKARAIAKAQESTGIPEVDLSLRILVLGKTGVGKSATINSIFDQSKSETDAFRPATDHIQEVKGTVCGVNITFIDTPGFYPSSSCSMRRNRKIMLSIKRYIKKHPPDVVLYFERLDLISMRYSDFPLLKLMTESFGAAMWFNTILVMTHSSSAPEGPSGHSINYESYVAQCSDLLQHYIHQAVSDTKLEIPVLLVENHPRCKKNSAGEYVLPNGQVWKPQFLFLCICTKVLGDVQSLLRFRGNIGLGQEANTRRASLPHLLSSFLRHSLSSSPTEAETELDEILLSELDEEDEYDQLPTIRVLGKSQFDRLSKSQKQEYLDELDYRETLYLKKQLKEECRKRQQKKLIKEVSKDNDPDEQAIQESAPLPDMAVPLSFDSDYPVHRYRCIITSDQWLVRPVYDPQGWDHDVGFDGISVETAMEMKKNLFGSVTGQISKDKQVFTIQSEGNAAYTDPRGPTYSVALDLQSSGKDLLFSVQGGTRNKTFKHNTTDLGVALTSFGNKYYVSGKIEDTLLVGKRLKFMVNAGRMTGSGQTAYGGSFEATIRGRDYPVRNDYIGLTITALSFKKDLVLTGGLQTQIRPSRDTKLDVNLNMNNRKMGQVSVKLSSSEHWEIALLSTFSIFKALLRRKAVGDTTKAELDEL